MSSRRIPLLITLSLAVLGGCSTRGAALLSLDGSTDLAGAPPVITDCGAAFEAYFRGELAACAFVDRCNVSAGPCCVQEVVCDAGFIVGRPLTCEAGCVECRSDRECPLTQLCGGTRCVACPFAPDGSACPPCPIGLEPVVRNGCATCDCRPHSDCRADPECVPGLTCFRGQACDPTCLDPDPLACCANACGAATCPFPVPVGCVTACPPALVCPGPCMSTACTCDATAWSCEFVCAPPGYPVRCAL